MIGIGQADVGNFFLFPILLKRSPGIRPNGENLRAALREFFVLVPHARQRRAAVRSHEAAQEGQHNGSAAKIGEAHAVTAQVIEFKFGSEFARG